MHDSQPPRAAQPRNSSSFGCAGRRPRLDLIRTISTLVAFVALLGWSGADGAAHADVRQHVLQDPAPDFEDVLAAFESQAKETGFQVTRQVDEKRSTTHGGVTISFRRVDVSLSHLSDGRSVSTSMFALTDPDPEQLAALETYVRQQIAYNNPMYTLRDLGVVTWYEYDPQTGASKPKTLETELADWRETYIDH